MKEAHITKLRKITSILFNSHLLPPYLLHLCEKYEIVCSFNVFPFSLYSLCLCHQLHHKACHQGLGFLHHHALVDVLVSNSLDPAGRKENH